MEEEVGFFEDFKLTILAVVVAIVLALLSYFFGTFSIKFKK